MFTLRPYQNAAVLSCYNHLRTSNTNPCIVLPTGSGKTIVMAQMVQDAVFKWNGRVLILAHVRELLEQTADKIIKLCPMIDIGMYSAGLKRRDVNNRVIVAGIQSVANKACDLGAFDLIMIDEAHRIPADGEGRYRTFLQDTALINPNTRIIGLTATPYRMKTGMVCDPEGILNEVCIDVSIKDLVSEGYLCKLRSKCGKNLPNTDGLKVLGGEFVQSHVHNLMNKEELVESACNDIMLHTRDRKRVLIFASGVEHGRHIAQTLRSHKRAVGTIFGDTLAFDRDMTLQDFDTGKIKYLVNVNVLTEGFDSSKIDCVALVRPTASPGLYYQMVGRGLRIDEGKEDCLILDFGNNIVRHGPIDNIFIRDKKKRHSGPAPMKTCPTCQEMIAASLLLCPNCGHDFSKDTYTHEAIASEANILSGGDGYTELITYDVTGVQYKKYKKKGWEEGDPHTLRVGYRISFFEYQYEWVCFEHSFYVRAKAEMWWKQRTTAPVPRDVDDAISMIENGALAEPTQIVIQKSPGAKWGKIVSMALPVPKQYNEPGWGDLVEHESVGADIGDGDNLPF